MVRRRSSDCGDLLDFEEVRRRLQLGTRTDIGTHEIPVAAVIGSVSRVHEFDGCFRPRTERLRDLLQQIRTARPNAADTPILVYQVDHAYFVVDGHKRLAIAVEEGRTDIDAEVGLFPSRFHVARGTTMDEIRVTELERRFRETTGLDVAAPEARFPVSDPDAYLELAESVKAHAYDLSRDLGVVVEPSEAARHWLEVVFRPVLEVGRAAGLGRVLSSCTEPELFLVLRRGYTEPMDHGWKVPASFLERSGQNLRAAEPSGVPAAVARMTRRNRSRSGPNVLELGDVAIDRDGDDSSIIQRPRHESEPPPT
jgi:hypothetical protein